MHDIFVADSATLLAEASHDGPVWSHAGAQLTANLLRFQAEDGIPAHRNDEVEVLIVVVAGRGTVRIDQAEQAVVAGSVLVIPVGVERSIQAHSTNFAYVTCHQRRAGLQVVLPPASQAL